MARRKPTIGRAELQVLRYIADHHPISVREVADHFAKTAGQARTTILTVMERLRRKGYLRRRKAGGVYRYAPRMPKGELLRSLVRDFVEESLGGSLSPFVAYLAQETDVSPEALEELKRLVDELEAQRKERTR